jgi:enamine deaminase RidA (YjgF/YER057c/UK114 family)
MREAINIKGAVTPAGQYSHALIANGFMFVSGPGPATDGFSDHQVRLTIRSLRIILQGAGADLGRQSRDEHLSQRQDALSRVKRDLQRVLPRGSAGPHHGGLPACRHSVGDRLHRGAAQLTRRRIDAHR